MIVNRNELNRQFMLYQSLQLIILAFDTYSDAEMAGYCGKSLLQPKHRFAENVAEKANFNI
jgi:hypothetical protein